MTALEQAFAIADGAIWVNAGRTAFAAGCDVAALIGGQVRCRCREGQHGEAEIRQRWRLGDEQENVAQVSGDNRDGDQGTVSGTVGAGSRPAPNQDGQTRAESVQIGGDVNEPRVSKPSSGDIAEPAGELDRQSVDGAAGGLGTQTDAPPGGPGPDGASHDNRHRTPKEVSISEFSGTVDRSQAPAPEQSQIGTGGSRFDPSKEAAENAPPLEPEWMKPVSAPVSRYQDKAESSATDILRRVPPQDVQAEQGVLGALLITETPELQRRVLEEVTALLKPEDFYRESHRVIYRAMLKLDEQREPLDAWTLAAELREHRQFEDIGGAAYLAQLAATVPSALNALAYARIVHEKAALRDLLRIGMQLTSDVFEAGAAPIVGELVTQVQRALSNVNGNGRPARSIIVETYQEAAAANEIYLARPEIIERLGYAQASGLLVGGKHHGKSTCIRTLAMAVVRGLPAFGRATSQGAVIYAVSDDELATARMELLRMGWAEGREPLAIVHKDPEAAIEHPQKALDEIAEEALAASAVMIVFDMLFDFTPIRDEMSYAHTREAVGQIQRIADATKTFVLSSHHSPKYLLDTASAATAALGSQGIAARFTPIILARRWADQLYTIESTTTRDPRGLALPQRVVKVDESGWAQDGGEFKSWMKWQVYAPRIIGLFEGGEPGLGRTVASIAKDLEIARPEVQNALYQLSLPGGPLVREKHGRSYKYYLRIEGQEWFEPRSD